MIQNHLLHSIQCPEQIDCRRPGCGQIILGLLHVIDILGIVVHIIVAVLGEVVAVTDGGYATVRNGFNFSALKAILEGSVSAKGQNVVIYATSNRRHLVKESFSDREGDDIHRNDTMQEIISLSERFGIQVTFSRPDKKTYLDIVHHLADSAGIEYEEEKIDLAAERFVLSRGSRSARAARQFVDNIISGNIIL